MSRLLDALTGLASPWAYVVIGSLAALEASAFVGLFIPRELALLTGAPGVVVLGYAAGSSYQRVEHYAGRAGLLLLTVAAAVVGIVLTARWTSANQDQLRTRANAQLDRPRVAAFRSRYRTRLDFMGRRLTPTGALGISLTLQLAILAAGGWLFGSILQDVIGRDDLARFDRPITNYLVDHRTAWLTTTMRATTTLGSTAVLIPTIAVVGLAIRRHRRTWEPLAVLVITQLGAIALYDTVKVLVARPRPHVGALVATASGYAFPSGHATQAVAVWGTIALILMPAASVTVGKIALGAGAAIIALLVGITRVYLGVHWTTDVLGGWALGALWLTAVTATRKAIKAGRPPPLLDAEEAAGLRS